MELEFSTIGASEGGEQRVPYYEGRVQAGFPSPVRDERGDIIDLNRELISSPSSTFCARVLGDSMRDAGINEGDILVVDRSLPARDGCIAVCFIDGDFTVKRISVRDDGVYLVPANAAYPELHVPAESNFQVWGVVSWILKNMRKR